jgi:hypothetical protein
MSVAAATELFSSTLEADTNSNGMTLRIETLAGFWEIRVEAPVHTTYCGLLKQPETQEMSLCCLKWHSVGR